MGAASKMRVIHFTENPPEKDEKKAMSLCGYMLPMKEITRAEKEVSCFMCFERMEGRGRAT